MKILWFNWRDIKNPNSGGAEIMTHQVLKRFAKDGTMVTLFTSEFKGSLKDETIDGVRIVRKGSQITCHIWAIYYYFKFFRGNFDLIVDEINTIPFFTILFAKEKKVALIHQLAKEYWWSEIHFPISFVGFFLEPIFLRLYLNVPTIAASLSTQKDLKGLGFKKVYVFHQGLSLKPLLKVPSKSKTPLILYIGRLTKAKGAYDSVKAFHQIKAKLPQSELAMIVKGSDKAFQRLNGLIKKLNLTSSVKTFRSANDSFKKRLLKNAHVVLIPSRREGWNLVAVESNAYGAIPIGYNVAGLQDSIKNRITGYLSSINKPEKIAEITLNTLGNQSLQDKIRKEGLQWSKKFTWDKTYLSFKKTLKKLDLLKEKSKKILVLSWRDPKHPFAGGAEQMIYQHARSWIKAGFQVTLFSSRYLGALKEDSFHGIRIIRQGHQYLGVQFAAFFYYLTNQSFDLIIDQFHGLSFFTPLFIRKPKLALIHEVAKELWFMNILPKPFNKIVGAIGYFIEPIIFLFYKKITFLTVSPSTKKDLIKLGVPKGNIRVILNGVSINMLSNPTKKQKNPTILFLGILAKDKGIEDALASFALLSKNPSFNFWVIGKPENKDYEYALNNLTRQLGLAKRVKFWGYVSENKKFKLLSQAHILVNPSFREGWGLVNIEANSVGTPVVAYKTPGLVDSVKHNYSGILCKSNTPMELATEIFKLINSKSKYQKLQKKSLLWSKKYSWEESSKKSLKLIQGLIK